MKKILLSILMLTFIILTSCKPTYFHTAKNLKDGGANKNINLYAFVGKKISVTEFDPNEDTEPEPTGKYEIDEETGDTLRFVRKHYVMDRAFKCKYQVLRKMFNYLRSDTVEFIAYDHYGTPRFAESDSVILYISKSEDGSHYFHQKYQFDKVYIDKKGRYYSYPKFTENASIKTLENLYGFDKNFKNEKYNISELNNNSVKKYYPSHFYKIENNFAIPVKGVYLYPLTNHRLFTTFKDLTNGQ